MFPNSPSQEGWIINPDKVPRGPPPGSTKAPHLLCASWFVFTGIIAHLMNDMQLNPPNQAK